LSSTQSTIRWSAAAQRLNSIRLNLLETRSVTWCLTLSAHNLSETWSKTC